VLESKEREEREEEVCMLEEKMDDLLSKTKLPEDAENIDTEILEKKKLHLTLTKHQQTRYTRCMNAIKTYGKIIAFNI